MPHKPRKRMRLVAEGDERVQRNAEESRFIDLAFETRLAAWKSAGRDPTSDQAQDAVNKEAYAVYQNARFAPREDEDE